MSTYTFGEATLLYAKHFDVVERIGALARQDIFCFFEALTEAVRASLAPRTVQVFTSTSDYHYWYLAPDRYSGTPKVPYVYTSLAYAELPLGTFRLWGYAEVSPGELATLRKRAQDAARSLTLASYIPSSDKRHVFEATIGSGAQIDIAAIAGSLAALLESVSNAE